MSEGKINYWVRSISSFVIRFKDILLAIAIAIFVIYAIKALKERNGNFLVYLAILVGLVVYLAFSNGIIKF